MVFISSEPNHPLNTQNIHTLTVTMRVAHKLGISEESHVFFSRKIVQGSFIYVQKAPKPDYVTGYGRSRGHSDLRERQHSLSPIWPAKHFRTPTHNTLFQCPHMSADKRTRQPWIFADTPITIFQNSSILGRGKTSVATTKKQEVLYENIHVTRLHILQYLMWCNK